MDAHQSLRVLHDTNTIVFDPGWSSFDHCQLCNKDGDTVNGGVVLLEGPSSAPTLSCLDCWETFTCNEKRKPSNMYQEIALQVGKAVDSKKEHHFLPPHKPL